MASAHWCHIFVFATFVVVKTKATLFKRDGPMSEVGVFVPNVRDRRGRLFHRQGFTFSKSSKRGPGI